MKKLPFGKRVPFVAQMEVTECGAASLGMILAYHGCHVPLAELRVACAVSRDGASALDIVKAAKRYGLRTRALKVERVEDLPKGALPAILHWDFHHFVVLERLGRNGADIVDPGLGRRHVSREELDRSFTGVVLALAKGPELAKRPRASRNAATYRRLLRGAAGPLAVMISSALLLEGLGLFFPAATGFVVDFVVRPRQERWLLILAIAFVVSVLLRVAMTMARDRILGGVESRVEIDLVTGLVKHLVSLPTAFFAQRGVGELLNRTESLLAARETVSRVLFAVFDVLLVVSYGTLMLLYDRRLGAIVVGLQLATLLITAIGRRRGRSAATTRQAASGRARSALVQAFADPETIKAFGSESLLLSRYAAARARQINAGNETVVALEPSQHAVAFLAPLASALVLWCGGQAVLGDRMTLGTLTSFLALQTLLGPPTQRILQAVQDLGDLVPILDQIDDVMGSAPEPTGTFVPEHLDGAITFENVSFRYGSKGPMLLDDVSFHVTAGERIAIAGGAGAGKSTIMKLILGFVKPLSGRVLIDGREVGDYDLTALRSSIGAVMAGGSFFDESVFENVTIGMPEATVEDLRTALAGACVEDVIERLPRGALTTLGTAAAHLSGGQRQRLLLARALVKRPALLLLDEASSALDAPLEGRIQTQLSRLPCTMILIAHRLSALSLADRILFLEKGKIVQQGSFGVLARRPGPFRELVVMSQAAG